MYNLGLRLMLISALTQLGFQLSEVLYCHSRECSGRLEKASQDVLRVNWKPISVWPEIGRQFK